MKGGAHLNRFARAKDRYNRPILFLFSFGSARRISLIIHEGKGTVSHRGNYKTERLSASHTNKRWECLREECIRVLLVYPMPPNLPQVQAEATTQRMADSLRLPNGSQALVHVIKPKVIAPQDSMCEPSTIGFEDGEGQEMDVITARLSRLRSQLDESKWPGWLTVPRGGKNYQPTRRRPSTFWPVPSLPLALQSTRMKKAGYCFFSPHRASRQSWSTSGVSMDSQSMKNDFCQSRRPCMLPDRRNYKITFWKATAASASGSRQLQWQKNCRFTDPKIPAVLKKSGWQFCSTEDKTKVCQMCAEATH